MTGKGRASIVPLALVCVETVRGRVGAEKLAASAAEPRSSVRAFGRW